MKNVYKKISLYTLTLMAYLLPIIVWADGGAGSNTSIDNPLEATSLDGLVAKGMDIVIYIGAIVAVLAIIWVGFMYVKAMGKPEKIKDAHKAALYTAIGIAILVGAQVITTIIINTINQIRS